MDRTTKGLFAIIACATLWSIGGLFIKLVDWHPMLIAGGRSLIAALFILAVRRQSRGKGFFRNRSRNESFAFVGAAVSYALTMIIFVSANKMTAAANVIMLQYSAPVFAALLGWALIKEKPRTEHWIALAAILIGLRVFFGDGISGISLLGDSLALVSGVTFAAYSVFMRMQKEGTPEDSIILAHLATAAIALPFAFIAPPQFSIKSVASIVVLGAAQIGLSSLFFAYGIRRVTAVQAMLAAVVEPVLNPVWVLLATGERPGPSAIAGGLIILAAVTGSSIVSATASRRGASAELDDLTRQRKDKDREADQVGNAARIDHQKAAGQE